MSFNIDTVIFFVFLAANLYFGLKFSTGVKTLKQYAIGDRDFNSYTVAGTLIATWVCGEFFYTITTETYKEGLFYIIATLGNTLCFFIMAWLLIPRMSQFLGNTSIAEAMGDLYGKEVRVLTAIMGFIAVVGVIAAQLKIAGFIFEYVLNIPYYYGIILSGLVITFYSSLGGIKAVTFTDLIQLFTFITIIPILTYKIFHSIGDMGNIIDYVKSDPNYNLHNVFNLKNKKSWFFLFLTFYMIIPSFNPSIFQRISMSRNITACQKSFYITVFAILFLTLVVGWLGLVFKVHNPNIASQDFLKAIVDCLPTIYKGLLLVGLMATIMSTADSYINSSSVLITHDFLAVLRRVKNELLTARFMSLFLGLAGIILALKDLGVFQIVMLTSSFYMATVTVPFMMAIFSYQTPYKKAVLWGMAAGLCTVLSWQYFNITVIDAVIPAMFANLVTYVIMHKYYYAKELASKANGS